jgi:pyruvate kinase
MQEAKANLAQKAKTAMKQVAASSSSSSGDVDVAQELITAAQVARIIAKINKEEGS